MMVKLDMHSVSFFHYPTRCSVYIPQGRVMRKGGLIYLYFKNDKKYERRTLRD